MDTSKMGFAAASSGLKVQIILLMVALGGYGLAWLILERSRRRASANAHVDAESGAMHVIAFDEEITREVARSQRTGEELCLALIEVGPTADGEDPDRDDLRAMASQWRGAPGLPPAVRPPPRQPLRGVVPPWGPPPPPPPAA